MLYVDIQSRSDFVDLGIKEIIVALSRDIFGSRKKSLTTFETVPTKSHDEVKNSIEKPSGLGALFLNMAKTVALISSKEEMVISLVARVSSHLNGGNACI